MKSNELMNEPYGFNELVFLAGITLKEEQNSFA